MLITAQFDLARWGLQRQGLSPAQARELESVLQTAKNWRPALSESYDGAITLLVFHKSEGDIAFIFDVAEGGIRMCLMLGDQMKNCGWYETVQGAVARFRELASAPQGIEGRSSALH